MGKGDVSTRSKSQKPSTTQNDQSPASNPTAAYPDWSLYQAYYNPAGTTPMTPPAYFHPTAAPTPQGHPYMWGPQMMPHYGAPPPYAAMYPQGTPYQQTPIPPGAYPYSPYPMQSPNGAVQTAASGAGVTETDKSSKSKHRSPLKRSKGSLGSLDVVAAKNSKTTKPSASSSNEGSSQSQSGSGSSSEGSSSNSKDGSRSKDVSENGRGDEGTQKGRSARAIEPTQASSAAAVLNPLMPYWPVPPQVAGPATSLNIGMDYWGASPASISMHGKLVAAPSTTPSTVATSREKVPLDPAMKDEREMKRQKRKQSNRESARRSRLRKQAEWEEVANRASILKEENNALKEEVNKLQEKCDNLTSENSSLHGKLKELEHEKSKGNW